MKPHDWIAFQDWGVVPPEPGASPMIHHRATPVLTPAPRRSRRRLWVWLLVLALVAIAVAFIPV